MRVDWLNTALDDRVAIFEYLFERNPYAAITVTEALILAANNLAVFPYRGRPGLVAGTRELVSEPPYLLIYEVDAGAEIVRILRVWHSARDRSLRLTKP